MTFDLQISLDQTSTLYSILSGHDKSQETFNCNPLIDWQIPTSNHMGPSSISKSTDATEDDAEAKEQISTPDLLTFSSNTTTASGIGDHVQYISFRRRMEDCNNTRDLLDPFLWSYPVRLKPDAVNGSRLNISILERHCTCASTCSCGYHSRCVVMSVIVSLYGVVYLTVEEELHSTVSIHNNSAELIYFGQTVANEATRKIGKCSFYYKVR